MKIRYIPFLFFLIFNAVAYPRTLNIGTLSHDPPFSFEEISGTLSGFDIDLMHEICRRIQTQCNFKTLNFHNIFSALNSGEIDLAIAAIIITPERRKQFLFSLPYKFNNLQYLTLAKSSIQKQTELTGKNVGVYVGSPEIATIIKQFNGNITLKPYNHVIELVNALENKQVDAIVIEHSRAIYWLANTNNFKKLGHTFRAGEGYGIAAKLGSNNLVDKINKALIEIEKDGTYLQIYQEYF